MANRAKQDEVIEAIRQYLEQARTNPPDLYPISINALSNALGYHRNTVRKYADAEELEKAKHEQDRFARSRMGRQKQEAAERISKRDDEIEALRTRCEALLAQIAKAEGNAQRLGIDPVELWKPLQAPPHAVPNQGR